MTTPQITPFSFFPARNQPAATFVTNMDGWLQQLNTVIPQMNVVVTQCDADVVSTGASAATASAAAIAAAASSSAAGWVSGNTYTVGQVVWSTTNYLPYRCKAGTSGTTDPSLDGTHWVLQNTLQPYQIGNTITNPLSANLAALTKSSTQVQTIAPNTYGLTVTYPDATTLPTLGEAYVVKNLTSAGSFPVAVNDNGGNLVAWALPGATLPALLESNAASTGVWRVSTGDRAADNGIYWWGASALGRGDSPTTTLSTLLGGVTQSNHSAFGLNSHVLVMAYPSSTPTLTAQTYTLADGGIALSSTLNLTSAYMPATHDVCENGTWEVLYAYPTSTGATGPTVQSVAINSSTFALTSNVIRTGAAVVCSTVALDNFTAGNSSLVYTETTSNKAWIAIVSSTGAGTTLNTAVALSATTGMINAWVATLSATLSHVMYTDGGTIYFNRVSISGTTPTPGSQLSITGGTNLGVANTPYAAESCQIDSTHSLHVWVSGAVATQAVWATVLTDTGSVITKVDTQLTTMTQGNFAGMALQGAYKMPNAAILLQFGDTFCRKFAIVRCAGTTPLMSPLVDMPGGGMPIVRTAGLNLDYPSCCIKSVTGQTAVPLLNVQPAAGAVTMTFNVQLQPVCTA